MAKLAEIMTLNLSERDALAHQNLMKESECGKFLFLRVLKVLIIRMVLSRHFVLVQYCILANLVLSCCLLTNYRLVSNTLVYDRLKLLDYKSMSESLSYFDATSLGLRLKSLVSKC